jgi:hypothetical protein
MKFKRISVALLGALACGLGVAHSGGNSSPSTDKSPYAFTSKRKTKSKVNTVSQKKKRLNARRLGR